MDMNKLLSFNCTYTVEQAERKATLETYENIDVGSTVQLSFGSYTYSGVVTRKRSEYVGTRQSEKAILRQYELTQTHSGFLKEIDISGIYETVEDILAESYVPFDTFDFSSYPEDIYVKYKGDNEDFVHYIASALGLFWYFDGEKIKLFGLPSGTLTLPDDVLAAELEEGYLYAYANGIKYKKSYTTTTGIYHPIYLKRNGLRIVIEQNFTENDENYSIVYAEQVEQLSYRVMNVVAVSAVRFSGSYGITNNVSSSVSEWEWTYLDNSIRIRIRKAVQRGETTTNTVENFIDAVVHEGELFDIADFQATLNIYTGATSTHTIGSEPYKEISVQGVPGKLVDYYVNKELFKTKMKILTYRKEFARTDTIPTIGVSSEILTYEVKLDYDSVADLIYATVRCTA